jgi:hypothetical protein
VLAFQVEVDVGRLVQSVRHEGGKIIIPEKEMLAHLVDDNFPALVELQKLKRQQPVLPGRLVIIPVFEARLPHSTSLSLLKIMFQREVEQIVEELMHDPLLIRVIYLIWQGHNFDLACA